MEVDKDVVLHVYKLLNDDATASRGGGGGGGMGGFLSRLLPSMGMGAYHTSLEVDGYRYTFAANAGIIKTSSRNEGVPTGANFQESIPLGANSLKNRGELTQVVKILGDEYFTSTAYHLVHRNCNHFTETLATAIILNRTLAEPNNCPSSLSTYPTWINRLANTSQNLIGHDEDIVSCNVLKEAKKAVGADEKVTWGLSSSKKESSSSSRKVTASGKKELSEKQKAALAKIRKK